MLAALFGDGKHYEAWVTVSGRQWRSLYGLASGGADTSPRLPSVANALVTVKRRFEQTLRGVLSEHVTDERELEAELASLGTALAAGPPLESPTPAT